MKIVEYDIDAASRKWRNTCAIFKGVPYYVKEVDKDKFYVMPLPVTVDSMEVAIPSEVDYTHIKSGWYPSNSGKQPMCLTRLFTKSFKAGVCNENYSMYAYDPDFNKLIKKDVAYYCNLLALENVEFPNWQIYKRRFLCTKDSIYYLTTKIGFIERGKVNLLYKELQQEVTDALRESTCLKI